MLLFCLWRKESSYDAFLSEESAFLLRNATNERGDEKVMFFSYDRYSWNTKRVKIMCALSSAL